MFFDADNNRKAAVDVSRIQRERRAQELPGKPGAIPRVDRYTPSLIGTKQIPSDGTAGMARAGGAQPDTGKINGQIYVPSLPPLKKATAAFRFPQEKLVEMPMKTRRKAERRRKPQTLMAARAKREERKKPVGGSPFDTSSPAGRRAGGRRVASNKQGRKSRIGRRGAIAAGAGTGALFYGIGDSMAKAAAMPKTAGIIIKFALYCLGIDCMT